LQRVSSGRQRQGKVMVSSRFIRAISLLASSLRYPRTSLSTTFLAPQSPPSSPFSVNFHFPTRRSRRRWHVDTHEFALYDPEYLPSGTKRNSIEEGKYTQCRAPRLKSINTRRTFGHDPSRLQAASNEQCSWTRTLRVRPAPHQARCLIV